LLTNKHNIYNIEKYKQDNILRNTLNGMSYT